VQFAPGSNVLRVMTAATPTNHLHAWFDQLASGKGLCCSFADGVKVEDVDWDTLDGRYRVRLHGEWVSCPRGQS
jgi:hypothetical protein